MVNNQPAALVNMSSENKEPNTMVRRDMSKIIGAAAAGVA
jgi:hypothetical protein